MHGYYFSFLDPKMAAGIALVTYCETIQEYLGKLCEASFPRCPAELVYWGKGYKSVAYVTGNHAPSPKPLNP